MIGQNSMLTHTDVSALEERVQIVVLDPQKVLDNGTGAEIGTLTL